MVDVAQLERTLDLWASMWQPKERAQFERAMERVLEADGATPLKLAALTACRAIGTPRLLDAAERAAGDFSDEALASVAEVAEPRARLLTHAARLTHNRVGVTFLLDKAVRQPDNRVADLLLDRIDIRDLYAALQASFDDDVRAEAARRVARRGPHQRARLRAALDLPADAFDEQLAVDVPLDDLSLDGAVDVPVDDFDADVDTEREIPLSA
jgi:hypothetical protein